MQLFLAIELLLLCFMALMTALILQGKLAWVEPILNGPTPAARKGASAACAQNRFIIIFGGKGIDADGKEVFKDDLLLLEMEGSPSTIKVSSLNLKGPKPAPRLYAMFQVITIACAVLSQHCVHICGL